MLFSAPAQHSRVARGPGHRSGPGIAAASFARGAGHSTCAINARRNGPSPSGRNSAAGAGCRRIRRRREPLLRGRVRCPAGAIGCADASPTQARPGRSKDLKSKKRMKTLPRSRASTIKSSSLGEPSPTKRATRLLCPFMRRQTPVQSAMCPFSAHVSLGK
jgi:hypothetical protein